MLWRGFCQSGGFNEEAPGKINTASSIRQTPPNWHLWNAGERKEGRGGLSSGSGLFGVRGPLLL